MTARRRVRPLAAACRDVAQAAREIYRLGLVRGTAGNVSARDPATGYIAITPSAVPYDAIRPQDIVVVDRRGTVLAGRYPPSTELPMHIVLYDHRPWARGIVHTHSVYATAFACLGQEIPPAHYLIAFVGPRIPIAPYAPHGTPEIGQRAADALGDCRAVLLQNHGVVAVGRTVAEAQTIAEIVEFTAEVGYKARAIGAPVLISDDELERLRARFETYGRGPSAKRV
jgi:L-fuculose-phosphate aldolase